MTDNSIVRAWRIGYGNPGTLDVGTFHGADRASSADHWISSASIGHLSFGTGPAIYNNAIIPAITAATSEIVIVTCFWARSPTLDSLSEALIELSQRHCNSRQREDDKIRVRICFSSSSLLQKILHTPSLAGRNYSPDEWTRRLGLPSKERLKGLQLEIKSVFVFPFSVMHPKFVIVDRKKVFFPSCNVSWENWFEGCVELGGPIVQHFVDFWKSFWADDCDRGFTPSSTATMVGIGTARATAVSTFKLLASSIVRLKDTPAIFLPSPHHRDPRLTFPWRPSRPPPATALNTFLLTSFSNAWKDIYIQTPNLTAPPVLSALLAALKRGVNVTIVTSERLMILEQLVTAGTTTKRCVSKLVKRHRQLMKRNGPISEPDAESGIVKLGRLDVSFFIPAQQGDPNLEEPVQSHVKATIIDLEITVLGSGNMDRASWYTSQELGVAFVSIEFARLVRSQLDGLMGTRTRPANRLQ